jgi:FAD/FMN-containing dehydrogenase
MSFAVQTLVQAQTPFAVRGGGHMPIAGSANINSTGVLLSSSNLTDLILSADNSTITVGPGNRWGAVYDALEPTGRAIVGGRLGVVGVPGFLLGGGISFFGNEYGWASANIARFEVSDCSVIHSFIDFSSMVYTIHPHKAAASL